ncbi:putative S-layer protein [Candidatus Woesearchaeota archaeon]|nr:putative S-layer protein [Candidatus Woesearchaeota archaeon]MBI2661211.1 putative S-layer protein [Candidatus Woesearchaeota archaeon]
MAYALPVTIEEVKIDNDVITQGATNILDLERGQEVDVKIRVKGNAGIGSLDNVQVEAVMRGSDNKDLVEDITESFRVKENVSYVKTLSLRVPSRLEQDKYKLRIRVEDRDGDTTQANYEIEISSKRHDLTIKDVVLNPENEVRAGRVLLASLRVKNTGQKDEKGIKVRVSVPELGISASDYVDEIEREDQNDDQVTSNELFLRIPEDAETGEYTLRAEAFFRDGDEKVTRDVKIRVLGSDSETAPAKASEKTVVVVPTDYQAVAAGGSEVAYPITLTNSGSASKTYVVTVDGANWGTFRVSPSNVVVVEPGQSKAVNVHVSANKGASGEQVFLVSIKSDDRTLKQIPLKALVSAGNGGSTGSKLKTVLEVLVVVLLVILVLIALVFGFNKMMKGGNGESKEGETYY